LERQIGRRQHPTAGKHIANGVYADAQQGVSVGVTGTVQIEIMPHVTLDAEVSASGGNGLGLSWSKNY
jgi:autotransporter translocation and assembly factor TamB